MHRWTVLIAVSLVGALVLPGCPKDAPPDSAAAPTPAVPPVARTEPKVLEAHGDERVDPYYWMRERDDPEVIAYLEAENAYGAAALAHTEPLRKALYDEMLARIQEDDSSVPWPKGDWLYYARSVEGQSYNLFCRKAGEEGEEQVLLDGNTLADGHEYFALGDRAISPDHRLLAYSVDTEGDELYALRIRDLDTGADLPDAIHDAYYGLEWDAAGEFLFYVTVDEALRPYRLWRHALGTDPAEDVLVYEEADESYWLTLDKTRSERFLVVSLGSTITTEVHVLETADPTGELTRITPRDHGVEYYLEHHGDRFLIWTNEEAVNFKLMETPVATPGKEHWTELIAHRQDVMFEGVAPFSGHLVMTERDRGVRTLRVRDLASGEEHYVDFPEPSYGLWPGENAEFDTTTLRFLYTSLVTPWSTFDYDLVTRERTLRREQPVLGGFDRADYISERIHAAAPDGTLVPISLVRRVDTPVDGTAPLYLTGYGSYGSEYDAYFDSPRLSLLDRGFVFAIAHVRGGGDLGRPWYDAGKLLHKKNTFTDFIAAAEHLVAEGYAAPDKVAIQGGSAGGLLMGAVVNLRPDLFTAVVADVPFVDVVTTMLDETIPLTVVEWEEWGNPNERDAYDYMKSYSPYDNVAAVDYPHLLILAGLNDPRVQYWEPAKWAAKLRATKTDDHVLVLKTNMGAGHGGQSGRYGWLRDQAYEYAFVLDSLGVAE